MYIKKTVLKRILILGVTASIMHGAGKITHARGRVRIPYRRSSKQRAAKQENKANRQSSPLIQSQDTPMQAGSLIMQNPVTRMDTLIQVLRQSQQETFTPTSAPTSVATPHIVSMRSPSTQQPTRTMEEFWKRVQETTSNFNRNSNDSSGFELSPLDDCKLDEGDVEFETEENQEPCACSDCANGKKRIEDALRLQKGGYNTPLAQQAFEAGEIPAYGQGPRYYSTDDEDMGCFSKYRPDKVDGAGISHITTTSLADTDKP